jgi:3-oxoadipyl-CoA thiolase
MRLTARFAAPSWAWISFFDPEGSGSEVDSDTRLTAKQQLTSAWIVDACRTPIGRYGGALADVRADDLAGHVLARLIARTGADPQRIDDVIFGAANQSGEDNRNVARMAALLAGFPVSVPGVTVNRLCGSGLQAINDAAAIIEVGRSSIVLAGGVESMTRAPYVMPKAARAFARDPAMFDTTIGWRMVNARMPDRWTVSLGETAERVAERYHVSREDQDRFALRSQQRAHAAALAGRFDGEIEPIDAVSGRSIRRVETDEHPRPDVTYEGLAAMKPAFRPNGTVTAGNSSGINDGACALLLASNAALATLGRPPLGRVVASAVAGVEPDEMGMGPVPALRKALTLAGLGVADIGLFEINEAFASQSVASVRELGLDEETVNVNGGAIALGHPLGCSGARLATTLLYEMRRRGVRYGAAAMCIGVGQGIATIFEAPR